MKTVFLVLCLSFLMGLSSIFAEEISKEEKIAINWEKVINSALEQKYVVHAKIYMGKSEKIVDLDRVGSILILTLKSNDKVALAMPFKTTDKDGNKMDLFFEFEK